MDDPQDRDVTTVQLIQDHEGPDGKAPYSNCEVVTHPANARMFGQQPQPLGNCVDHSVRRCRVACLAGDVVPYGVEIVARTRREAICH